MTDAPLDIDALERSARNAKPGALHVINPATLLALISAYRRLERDAWIRGRDAAATCAEDENSFIAADAIRALQPPEGS